MMPLYSADSISSGMKGPDLPSVGLIDELHQLATQPNARYVRFDKNDDVFYIVSTNENNYKTISRYRIFMELDHATRLFKMFEQYYGQAAKAFTEIPEHMSKIQKEITEKYMKGYAKVKALHDAYNK